MQNKNIYIISDISEQQYIKNKEASIIYESLDSYLIKKKSNNDKIKYLYENVLNNKTKNFKNIKFLWKIKNFLNRSDEFCKIPIHSILTRKVICDFSYDYRAYTALAKYIKKNNRIYISSNCSVSLKRLTKIFPNYFKLIKKNKINIDNSPSPIRAESYYLRVTKYSGIIRFFHKIFISKYENKILYFKDWTSLDEVKKSSNVIILNGKNILKNAVYSNNVLILKKKYELNNQDKKNEFKKIFKNFNKLFNNDIYKIFDYVLNLALKDYRKKIDFAYNHIEETLNFYRPKSVILNGESDWLNLLISSICKSKKIKIILLIDGYQFYKDDFVFFKFNKKLSFDEYFCFGDANYKLLYKSGVKNKALKNINHPLLQKKNNFNKVSKKNYDFTILFYQPNLLNYQIPWDMTFLTHYKLLSMLDGLGVNNVCIKNKPGNKNLSLINDKILSRFKKLFQQENGKEFKIKIGISDEELQEHCEKTQNIIGQVSTSIIECFSKNVPYYIYEPNYNGSDQNLFKSINLFDKKFINYSINNLKNNIIDKKYLKIENKNLFKKKRFIDFI